jgi:hypothetical protein
MKVRILLPGRKVDDVAYRCEGLWRRGHPGGAASFVKIGELVLRHSFGDQPWPHKARAGAVWLAGS